MVSPRWSVQTVMCQHWVRTWVFCRIKFGYSFRTTHIACTSMEMTQNRIEDARPVESMQTRPEPFKHGNQLEIAEEEKIESPSQNNDGMQNARQETRDRGQSESHPRKDLLSLSFVANVLTSL